MAITCSSPVRSRLRDQGRSTRLKRSRRMTPVCREFTARRSVSSLMMIRNSPARAFDRFCDPHAMECGSFLASRRGEENRRRVAKPPEESFASPSLRRQAASVESGFPWHLRTFRCQVLTSSSLRNLCPGNGCLRTYAFGPRRGSFTWRSVAPAFHEGRRCRLAAEAVAQKGREKAVTRPS